MAPKTRVAALAKELGVTSKEILAKLTDLGEYVKSASSTIEAPTARRIREMLAQPHATLAPNDAVVCVLPGLDRWSAVSELIRCCHRAQREQRPLILDLSQVQFAYPNTCVPVAAIIQHYKSLGISITTNTLSHRQEMIGLLSPLEATKQELTDPHRVVNRMWGYFDSDEATALTDAIVEHMETAFEMERGVVEALNLCLYEVVDNVFEHSEQNSGFFMAQLHMSSRRLALAVGDVGVGALNSFRGSEHHPGNDFDALTLAVQSGVTSTGDTPRGNGLYTLQRTVEVNGGRLELRSGTGQILIDNVAVKGGDFVSLPMVSRTNRGFFVDWQLNLAEAVRLEDVYTDMPSPPANLKLEALENHAGEHVIVIREHDAGLGTRRAAAQLRNTLTNKLNQGAPKLVLDFEGVAIVSASFADEVVGKLVEQFGVIGFMRLFEPRNMTTSIEQLLNRAIVRRAGS